MAGFKALLRWTDAELGSVPIDTIIPLSLASGMIVSIGVWVPFEACRPLVRWRARGYAVSVAVNITPAQFDRADLGGVVNRQPAESGASSAALELELIERWMLREPAGTARKLDALRAACESLWTISAPGTRR